MSGKVFFILLSFLLIFSFKRYSPGNPSLELILSAYKRVDQLFNKPNTSSKDDSACMVGFRKIISDLNRIHGEMMTDSLLYQSNYKLGVLYEIYKDYSKATASYMQAIKYSSTPDQKFTNYILAGAGYYNQNNFDSATYFLLRAAQSPDNLGAKEDRMRLFNTLGVLYYDNGNYLQSKNYFTQALLLIDSKGLTDKYSLELNIAACYFKLGLYEQALSIYKKILKYHILSTPLYMNMGRTYRGLGQYEAALSFFKRVNISKAPSVLNEMARTALEEGNAAAASAWLDQYRNEKKSLHTNALDDGENEIYLSDLDIYHDKPDSALLHLQNALVIFLGNDSNKEIHKNPVSFMGSFAYYRLFEVLNKKASAWEMVYRKTLRSEDLKAAYDTYQSTLSLLAYIEKSYEMDDAKILLKQKSGGVYAHAMDVCLHLDKLYPHAGYLDAAFLISEKNKASVMSSQIRERNFLSAAGSESSFEKEERNIKFNIARLNSRIDEHIDGGMLQKISDEKSAYETQLVKLHRKMDGNSRFYQLKYSDDFPSISLMQQSMSTDQALISFFNTSHGIEIFVLTKSALEHIGLDSGEMIRLNIQKWIQILQSTENGRHENTSELRKILYIQLMKPIIGLAGKKREWIIVPDGLFFQMPIESLPGDEDGKMIIEKHTVGYEFSARYIIKSEASPMNREQNRNVLSFAPFSQRAYQLQNGGLEGLEKLPFSKEEINGLPGIHLADQSATKDAFMKNIDRFSIIHLATHAITDLDNPSASFIAFYPTAGVRSEDFLFLDEIYSLNMDSCRMMVISACETGRGEFVHNEGVMSFARAFLYAGCPSTINTLWKADDHSTAEIIKLFYKYLEEGDDKSLALQQAKLEFIRNNPLFRNPAYWSHIVLTGDPSALYKKKQPWIWAVFAISCGTILFFTVRKRTEKKVDAFHS
jgi:CHAT domain-containing protein/tetratricopeptide (TPR) repeat protein